MKYIGWIGQFMAIISGVLAAEMLHRQSRWFYFWLAVFIGSMALTAYVLTGGD